MNTPNVVVEAVGLLVLLVGIGLGLYGFLAGARRNGDSEEREIAQERRLEQEEDTKDQGPM
jgi:hypothetical protein